MNTLRTAVYHLATDSRRVRVSFNKVGSVGNLDGGILELLTEGVVVEDAEGYLIFVNPAAAALLGYSVEELLGQEEVAGDSHRTAVRVRSAVQPGIFLSRQKSSVTPYLALKTTICI